MFQTLTLALPMIAIFYFLLWRPQSQRQKQLRNMVDNLRRGDTVVTAGGILGKIVKVSEAYITLEIANATQIVVQRAAVTTLLPKGTIKSI